MNRRRLLVACVLCSAAAGAAARARRNVRHQDRVVRRDLSRRDLRLSRRRGRRHAGRRRRSSTRSAARRATTRRRQTTARSSSRARASGAGRRRIGPGTYLLTFDGPGKKDAIAVHAFVMVPATRGEERAAERLPHRRRIRRRRSRAIRSTLPPPGFIEVTKDNQDTKVSPHFTLKQFLCKEDTSKSFPKYVAAQGAAAAQARGGARARQRLGVQGRHAARDERLPHAVLQPRDRRREVQHASVGQRRRHLRRSAEERSDGRPESRRPGRHAGFEVPLRRDRTDARATRSCARFQGGMGFYPATSRPSAVRARRRPRHRGAVERDRVEVRSCEVKAEYEGW